MDLARPSGIVFSSSLGIEHLPEATQKEFKRDKVFLRGVAEREPVDVFFDQRYTSIPESAHQPLDIKWIHNKKSILTLKEFKRLAANGYTQYYIHLENEPMDVKKIIVSANWKVPARLKTSSSVNPSGASDVPATCYQYGMKDGTQPCVHLEVGPLVKFLEELKLGVDQKAVISVNYPTWAKTDFISHKPNTQPPIANHDH